MNLGHDVSCDHPLQSPLPCRLLEEVVVCAGDLPSLPQPAERLITVRLFHTGRPTTRDPGSGSSTASRVRLKPPGSPARRLHSHSSVRPCSWAKRRRCLSCLLLLPVLNLPRAKPNSHSAGLKTYVAAECPMGDCRLSVTVTHTELLLGHLYNQKTLYSPPLIQTVTESRGEKNHFTPHTSGSSQTPALPHPLL